MKRKGCKNLATLLLFASALVFLNFGATYAQKAETFDIISFKTPKGWQKEVQQNGVQMGVENADGGICLITLFKSVPGGSDSKANFEMAWEALVKETVTVKTAPQINDSADENGWTVESGSAQYESDGKKGIVMLFTATGNSKMVNVLALTNTDAYQKDITDFLESISLSKITPATKTTTTNPTKSINPVVVASKNGFKFTTSNFDDGWNSVVNEDWVEVTKGNIKVLLHYPNAVTGKYYPDSDEGINAAWSNLIAPRYNGLQNYTAWYSTSILPRPYLIAGNTTDKQSGKNVYVVLFQKGNTGWIEIISPDKNTFINNFGVDNTTLNNYPDSNLFASLEKLADYNKFAIAATDLKGKWSDNYSATFFNYNASGQYTSTRTFAAVENFVFTSATSYNWDGYFTNNVHSAGSAKTFKTTGIFKMTNNWQIQFSDIQGKPKTYNAYFSCFKGGRVLWLQSNGSYTAYGKVK